MKVRLIPNKDGDYVFHLIEKLNGKAVDWSFYLCGDGPLDWIYEDTLYMAKKAYWRVH